MKLKLIILLVLLISVITLSQAKTVHDLKQRKSQARRECIQKAFKFVCLKKGKVPVRRICISRYPKKCIKYKKVYKQSCKKKKKICSKVAYKKKRICIKQKKVCKNYRPRKKMKRPLKRLCKNWIHKCLKYKIKTQKRCIKRKIICERKGKKLLKMCIKYTQGKCKKYKYQYNRLCEKWKKQWFCRKYKVTSKLEKLYKQDLINQLHNVLWESFQYILGDFTTNQ